MFHAELLHNSMLDSGHGSRAYIFSVKASSAGHNLMDVTTTDGIFTQSQAIRRVTNPRGEEENMITARKTGNSEP